MKIDEIMLELELFFEDDYVVGEDEPSITYPYDEPMDEYFVPSGVGDDGILLAQIKGFSLSLYEEES